MKGLEIHSEYKNFELEDLTILKVSLDGKEMNENETDVDLDILMIFHSINEDIEDATNEIQIRSNNSVSNSYSRSD